MIKVDITPVMKQRATRKANVMGKLYGSITKGKGNGIGFLGEEVANFIMDGDNINTTKKYNTNYDIVLPNGTTVEVKTKKTTVVPLPHYDCSVAAQNTDQKCDYYAFVRVHESKKEGWFLGWITKKAFYNNARFMKRGTIDRANGFMVKADCYNLAIDKLYQFNKKKWLGYE